MDNYPKLPPVDFCHFGLLRGYCIVSNINES